jgi:hypothetical protein
MARDVLVGVASLDTRLDITSSQVQMVRTDDSAPAELDIGLTRRQQQVEFIESKVRFLGYVPTKIPTGIKKKIMAECQRAAPRLFGVGNAPFNAAWQEAVNQGRVRMEEHHKFSAKPVL